MKQVDFKIPQDRGKLNPIFLIDFYKVGHVQQYPEGIKRIWVNFTPRSTRVEGETGVIFFGLQRFIKKVLIDQFNAFFFGRSWSAVEAEYIEFIQKTLGIQNPKIDHLKQLHEHGSLPLDIYALPEGTYVPFGVPALVIVNNQDWAFWLPNYIETMMSNNLWHACTSASTAHRYRRVFLKHAKDAGETDLSFVDWQGHDFLYRGLSGDEAAKMSGMGHLLSFSGTDTVPAILDAVKYYNADPSVGGSVPATEHSVMCAGGKETEIETFRRLITKTYPTGVVSIVSDTWNLWDVLTKIAPALKDEIMARQSAGPVPAKVVFRPDSGDPVKILTGDDDLRGFLASDTHSLYHLKHQAKGATRLLAEALGTTENRIGLRLINKAGLIYGDAITLSRADEILTRARAQGFHPYNYVFGIGSYTYQYVTRDTYNFAFETTAVERETPYFEQGETSIRTVEAIYKEPVTAGDFSKKSARGIPAVYWGLVGQGEVMGKLYVEETLDPTALDRCKFQKVFNGYLLIDDTFEAIRKRVRSRDNVSL